MISYLSNKFYDLFNIGNILEDINVTKDDKIAKDDNVAKGNNNIIKTNIAANPISIANNSLQYYIGAQNIPKDKHYKHNSIDHNYASDFSACSFVVYLNNNSAYINNTATVPVKCRLEYFSNGIDLTNTSSISGNCVYVNIYKDDTMSTSIGFGINPNVLELEAGNLVHLTGVRIFDNNIGILFEIYTK